MKAGKRKAREREILFLAIKEQRRWKFGRFIPADMSPIRIPGAYLSNWPCLEDEGFFQRPGPSISI